MKQIVLLVFLISTTIYNQGYAQNTFSLSLGYSQYGGFRAYPVQGEMGYFKQRISPGVIFGGRYSHEFTSNVFGHLGLGIESGSPRYVFFTTSDPEFISAPFEAVIFIAAYQEIGVLHKIKHINIAYSYRLYELLNSIFAFHQGSYDNPTRFDTEVFVNRNGKVFSALCIRPGLDIGLSKSKEKKGRIAVELVVPFAKQLQATGTYSYTGGVYESQGEIRGNNVHFSALFEYFF